MGMLCPINLKPCIDSMCRGGSGCFKCGESLFSPCPGCGQMVSDEDHTNCTCDPVDWDEDDTNDESN